MSTTSANWIQIPDHAYPSTDIADLVALMPALGRALADEHGPLDIFALTCEDGRLYLVIAADWIESMRHSELKQAVYDRVPAEMNISRRFGHVRILDKQSEFYAHITALGRDWQDIPFVGIAGDYIFVAKQHDPAAV